MKNIFISRCVEDFNAVADITFIKGKEYKCSYMTIYDKNSFEPSRKYEVSWGDYTNNAIRINEPTFGKYFVEISEYRDKQIDILI